MYYYDGFIDTWYPKNADGSYKFGQPEFWYSYLKMPPRLFESGRAKWYKTPGTGFYPDVDAYLPNVMWTFTWAFDAIDGNMNVTYLPDLPEFPKRDLTWKKIGSLDITLNNVPEFSSYSKNPGYGYAGELVIVDENNKEYVFDFWYESMYTSAELVGDHVVLVIDGKRAVSKLNAGDRNNKVYIGASDLFI